MSDRSVGVYDLVHAAEVKFDYFVCSVSGALFAYIAQTYAPQKIELGIPILMPLSLIFLAASFYCGLRRIEKSKVLTKINYSMLDAAEKAGEATKGLTSEFKSEKIYNELSGEIYSRQELTARRAKFMEAAAKYSADFKNVQNASYNLYRLRDLFLVLGFFSILAAKLLQPYENSFYTHLSPTSLNTNMPDFVVTNSTNKP
jgi:hypothetical protein